MAISIAPLVAIHMDSEVVSAVIMQLEIESHSSKGADQTKDCLEKGEWVSVFSKFNFSRPVASITLKQYSKSMDRPVQVFHPSVPTPPPNC